MDADLDIEQISRLGYAKLNQYAQLALLLEGRMHIPLDELAKMLEKTTSSGRLERDVIRALCFVQFDACLDDQTLDRQS